MSTERFDAIIVGAGFGGIGAAIQLNRLGYDNIAILDREDDLGGTWHVNRYPGLTVDVPSTTYSYWFEPNPYWSRLYARGPEMKRYAEHVADKYDVRRYMRFNTTVAGARWDEDEQLWFVDTGGGPTLQAQFLILATGYLCQPKTPDIPGIESFQGRVIHAAAWDEDYSMAGRRAAIIGTGSTGVQLIPELAKEVGDLVVYQRTPIWVLPKFDFGFTPAAQRFFARVPLAQRALRMSTDAFLDFMTVIAMWKFRYFKPVNKGAGYIGALLRFLSIRDKETRRKLRPDYDYGCKRPTLSNTYYRAFNKPNVHLETAGIERIEPDGIVTRDGNKRVIDTLVLATGFDVWESNLPAIEVIGRGGRNLGKWWRENKFQAYQGLTVPAFPNFMTQASPYAWVGMSWFSSVEYQMRHMNRLLGELQRRGAHTFEVTDEANARFLDRMTTLLDDSVFHLGNCATSRSYWFNASGEAPLFRPTSVRDAVRDQDRFPLSDYSIA
ncbi:flavin-containing monooxygenase [Mycolicibacterium palauense]|uniref:flavin-containing monooxygenase n=1 Tax=Mycolicibacterium palauense TaxID=2034511 RepID=UPI000BFF0674|nr:NAD(P)/FAD-dependent oxidoreductase [Mycolicibacterium palauense]